MHAYFNKGPEDFNNQDAMGIKYKIIYERVRIISITSVLSYHFSGMFVTDADSCCASIWITALP
jgi:hypothetical protein